MVAGFGLVDDAIIDQHFRQRDRTGRLLSLISGSPKLLGIGVDEDTAAVFGACGTSTSLAVTQLRLLMDRPCLPIFRRSRGTAEITVSGAVIHTLIAGRRFDRDDSPDDSV